MSEMLWWLTVIGVSITTIVVVVGFHLITEHIKSRRSPNKELNE